MNNIQKFSLSFAFALALHLTILALFGVSFSSESEVIRQKPLPEIIQASMLDEEKIQQEVERLKTKDDNKRRTENNRQKELETKRKTEQKLLEDAKKERQQEEEKAKALEKKNKEQALKDQQKLEKIKKQKALEAAKLAKIKKQKAAEKKRLEDLRQAEKKRKQEQIAKQKAEAAEREAKLKQQADAARARIEQNKQATITAAAAIQQKVNNRWIRPQTSRKGLNCTIRVKLLFSGDVMEATVIRSSGDSVFDRSAENAVRKASPLPVPKDRALFAREFRTFTFDFKPE